MMHCQPNTFISCSFENKVLININFFSRIIKKMKELVNGIMNENT